MNARVNMLTSILCSILASVMTAIVMQGYFREFIPGPNTPVAGYSMAVGRLWGGAAARAGLVDEASIWHGKVWSGMGIAHEFGPSFDASGSPANTVFIYAGSDGATSDVVSLLTQCRVAANNGSCWGGNDVARCEANTVNCKLVGREIDVLPAEGTLPSTNSVAMAINGFNGPIPGPGIFVNGVNNGSFLNGVLVGGVAPTGAAFAVLSGSMPNVGLDLSQGTYGTAAALIGNDGRVKFNGPSGPPAQIYNDTNGDLRIVAGKRILFRDNSDERTLAILDGDGRFYTAAEPASVTRNH